jgi:hypothetical protein
MNTTRSSERSFTHRINRRLAVFGAALLALGVVATPALAAWAESFAGPDAVWAEGSTNSHFNVVFNGYGTVGIASQRLRLSPAAPTQPNETHSALVRATTDSSAVDLSVDVQTVAQLRQGSPANAWEAGWVIWNYADNDHFWYLAVKPNGWEIGRRDPAGAGGQIFVATGSAPSTPIGQSRRVRIRHDGSNRLRVWLDGQLVSDLRRTNPLFPAAAIGFYSEDATVDFDNLTVTAA